MRVRTQTTHRYFIESDGFVIETQHRPEEYIDPLVEVVGDKLVVVYAVRDEYAVNPLEDYDGEGELYTRGRRNSTLNDDKRVNDALGLVDGQPDVEGIRRDFLDSYLAGVPDGDLEAFGASYGESYPYEWDDDCTIEDAREKLGERIVEGGGYSGWWDDRYRGTPWWKVVKEHQAAFDAQLVLPEWRARILDGRLGHQYAIALDHVSHESSYWTRIRVGRCITHYVRHVNDTPDIDGVWIPDNDGTLGNLLAVAAQNGTDPWVEAERYAVGPCDMVAAWIDGRVYVVFAEEHEFREGRTEFGPDTLLNEEDLCSYSCYGDPEGTMKEAMSEHGGDNGN